MKLSHPNPASALTNTRSSWPLGEIFKKQPTWELISRVGLSWSGFCWVVLFNSLRLHTSFSNLANRSTTFRYSAASTRRPKTPTRQTDRGKGWSIRGAIFFGWGGGKVLLMDEIPAPVHRIDRLFIPLFTRFYTSQVVQDFFHQRYE